MARAQAMSLLLGTCLLCLSLGCLAYAAGADALHRDRAASLTPVLCDEDRASLLYRFGGFTQVHNRAVTVIVISPLAADAPLPAGVRAWPAPGEAVVSPALAADLTGDLKDLFGPVSSVIGLEGLEVPQERRVYLRPSQAALNPAAMESACGFGAVHDGSAYAGSGSLYAAPLSDVVMLLAGTLLVPGAGAMFTAAVVRGEENRRRTTALIASGLRRRDLAVIDLAETWPGILGGLVLAGALGLASTMVDVRAPWLDSWFPAADSRTLAPVTAPAVLSGAVIAVATVLAARAAYRRPAITGWRVPRLLSPPVLVLAGLVLAVWYPVWNPTSYEKVFAYAAGVVLVVVALPGLISDLAGALGRVLAVLGLRSATPARLVAGRQLRRLSGGSRHLALAMTMALLLGGQIQLWAGSLSPQYYRSVELLDAWGEQTATLEHLDAAVAPDGLIAAMPEGAAIISTSWGGLTARVPVLIRDGLIDAGSDLMIVPAQTSMQVWSERAEEASVHLVSTTGRSLDLRAIERLLHALAPGVQAISGPQSWITAGEVNFLRSRWTITTGAVGLTVLILVLGSALAHDSARTARHLAPIGVVSGSARVAASAAAWRTAVIVVTSGVTATVLYLILPLGMARAVVDPEGVVWRPSPAYAALCLLLTALVALASTTSAFRAARAAANRWCP